jgi:uncharacterized protein YjbI with pentapeptide repeats
MPWKGYGNWKDIEPWKIAPEELLVRYDNGERNFAGIDLISCSETPFYYYEIELKGIILRDINLRGAVFREVNLQGVDLSGADLGGIFMEECILSEATICNANLRAANLERCSFINTDLRGSNLDYVNANHACFRGAKMNGFENAILTYADFEGASIDNSISSGMICFYYSRNLLWHTKMPDGSIIKQPRLC